MKRNNPINILIILVVAILGGYYLFPSVTFYMKSPEKRSEIIKNNPEVLDDVINLGLDLQGGMRLVLEIDKSKSGNRGCARARKPTTTALSGR